MKQEFFIIPEKYPIFNKLHQPRCTVVIEQGTGDKTITKNGNTFITISDSSISIDGTNVTLNDTINDDDNIIIRRDIDWCNIYVVKNSPESINTKIIREIYSSNSHHWEVNSSEQGFGWVGNNIDVYTTAIPVSRFSQILQQGQVKKDYQFDLIEDIHCCTGTGGGYKDNEVTASRIVRNKKGEIDKKTKMNNM